MRKQTSHSKILKQYPRKHTVVLNGASILECNIIKGNSLFFLGGSLLDEGIDEHYTILKESEVEFHFTIHPGKILTILTF